MNSEETLVAQAAKDLLAASLRIESIGQITLENDAEKLTLPCTVVSAKFESEEEGSNLPKKYELTVELRTLSTVHPADVMDEVYRSIGDTLMTTPATWPASITGVFDFFTIEAQTGSDQSKADAASRSRKYSVFARLL